jgi:hypothetical protein
MRVVRARMPRASTKTEYLRYFRDLTKEYNLRADRIESLMLAGETSRRVLARDFNVGRPTWELDDVLCRTNVVQVELEAVLPPLFDSLRRLRLAQAAVAHADEFRRGDRLALAAQGLDALISAYLLGSDKAARLVEKEISELLEPMHAVCRWPTRDHAAGGKCRKPAPWNKVGMGLNPDHIESKTG